MTRRQIGLRVTVATDVVPEDVEFLFADEEPAIPRRGVTIVTGRRGETKTTWACWLVAKATKEGINVLFVSLEDDVPSFLQPRLIAAGADLSRVFYPHVEDAPMRFPRDAAKLYERVRADRIGLVILDPLSAVIPTFTSPAPARDALTPLGVLSRELGVSIVFLHHFRKSLGKDVASAIGGAGAIQDAARAIFIYGGQPKLDPLMTLMGIQQISPDKRVLACEKLSGAAIPHSLVFRLDTAEIVGLRNPALLVVYEGTSDLSSDALFTLWTLASKAGDDALSEAQDFLYDALKDGPRLSAEVRSEADAAGISWRTIGRAKGGICRSRKGKNDMGEDPKAWYFELLPPPDAPPEDWK